MKKNLPPLLGNASLRAELERHHQLSFPLPRIAAFETLLIHQLTPSLASQGAILWLAPSVPDAQLLAKGWAYWDRIHASGTPAPHLFLPDRHHCDATSLAQLVELQTHSTFFIAPEMEFPLPEPSELLEHSFALYTGSPVTYSVLLTWLTDHGYDRIPRVSIPGELSVHGETMTIWAHEQEHPLRLAFNGEVMDSFEFFDVLTGKTIRKPRSVVLPPVTLPSSHEPIMQTMEAFLPASGTVIKEGSTLSPKSHAILFSTSPSPSLISSIRRPLPYHRSPQLIQECANLTKTGIIFVPESDEKQLRSILQQAHLFPKSLVRLPSDHPFPEGFLVDDRIAFLPLPSPKKSANRLQRTESDPLLLELKPGDYVVHLFHGIARFAGTTWMEVNGVKREFLSLHYAEKDRLYVPVEAMDRVERYIGAPDPELHSLSGTEWLNAVRKAKHYAKDIAYDLLRLQAKRAMVEMDPLPPRDSLEDQLAASFPYQETDDQLRALQHVEYDLTQPTPMDRLICGDVGFGKTEIAIRAAFKCAIHGLQVAVLSPTTILTQQHFDTFQERLQPLGVRIAMLSRWQSPASQKKILEQLATGACDIVIGTHRLLSSDVKFKKCGLIVIDEEQRFGVKHKEQLKRFRSKTHVLSLSATPIPRTLHMSLGGLKELSTLTTAPADRKPIVTTIERFSEQRVRKAVEAELKRNGQVYYLHNRVASIEKAAKQFHRLVPSARYGIAHGQLPEKELADMIKKFDREEIDVLICSTIIENGLDLKNVNTLIIPDITNLGLSQLYQIRGRIGRSDRQAYAYLFYPSQKMSGELRQRIAAFMEAKELGSGMRLAIRDLEIRGAGNLLGKEQHGNIHAIGLSLYAQLLEQAVEELKSGKPVEPIRDIPIDLPLPAFIPPSYTRDELYRMRLYQEITHQKTVEDLQQYKEKLDQKKSLPDELLHFFAEMELKLLAQHCTITGIDSLQRANGEQILRVKSMDPPPASLAAQGWEVREHTLSRPQPSDARVTFKLLRDLFRFLAEQKS